MCSSLLRAVQTSGVGAPGEYTDLKPLVMKRFETAATQKSAQEKQLALCLVRLSNTGDISNHFIQFLSSSPLYRCRCDRSRERKDKKRRERSGESFGNKLSNVSQVQHNSSSPWPDSYGHIFCLFVQ